MNITKAYNFININKLTTSSGTLLKVDLQSLSDADYNTIINLLPDNSEYAIKNEQETFKTLGIGYTYIPVDWEHPTLADFTAFETAMIAAKNKKTHIHCAANYRASAFYGIYAYKHLGWTRKQITEFTAPIWQLSDHPIWQDFVRDLSDGI